MICPFCKEKDTSVVDSRPTEDGTAIRRRRLCPCSKAVRFTTFERVQFRELSVIKKNGRRSPFDKTITLSDPNDELRIDSNFDGIFESGITEISNFNIRFKANDENLTTGSFSFKTHLTNYFEFQNYNNSLNDLGGVSFKVKATCVPKEAIADCCIFPADLPA